MLNVFLIIGGIALIGSFFMKKSAIWGGGLIGLMVGIVYSFINSDFSNILRFILLGADIGLLAELLGYISDRLRKKQ